MASFRALCVCALFVGVSGVASAQATRTWVSGVGDDANPCSRTAPCKTFAGAISKTAAGGEIDVLDPGGFGTLTITKSITIDGGGFVSSILSSATNGVNINASGTDTVTLRNLSINGAGSTIGVYGVRVLTAGTVHLENVVIQNFSNSGVSVATNSTVAVTLEHVLIRDVSGTGVVATGANSSSIATVAVSNFNVSNSGTGLSAGANTRVVVTDSTVTKNSGAGISVSGSGNLTLVRTTVAANTGAGVSADSSTGSPTVSLLGSTATLNNGAGIQVNGSGTTFIRLAGSALLGNTGGILGSGTTYLGTFSDNAITNGVTGVTVISIAKQ